MNTKIRPIVLKCCDDHNQVSAKKIALVLGDDAPLFGVDGVLDSIALVTLVVAVEQAIEDEIGVAVTLADAKATAQKSSPFRTIAALVAYSAARVEEALNENA